jgi:hypothetical protein
MRKVLKAVVLTMLACVATLAVANPAHAAVSLCGQQALRPDLPQVLLITCAEAEGNQRRATSTLVNQSAQPIFDITLESLISSPAYGSTTCRNAVLTPGHTMSCASPWVSTQPFSRFTSVFSLVQARDAQGRFISTVASFVAPF